MSHLGFWVTMKKILHYDVGEKLGEGKNGSTYLAWDPGLDRAVAIKILGQARVDDEAWQASYLSEALRVNQIASDRLANFFSLEKADDRQVIIREYVQGKSIKRLAAEDQIDFGFFLNVAVETTKALMDLQARDMVHGNLTSNNVVFAKEGLVKLVDAHLGTVDSSAMSTEDLTYLAPEQLATGEVGPRADMYSLGVVLHHLLTGELPYASAESASLRESILSGRGLFSETAGSRYPGDARLLIETLMAVDPSERFGGADELLHTLREMTQFQQNRSTVVVEKQEKWTPRQYLSVSLLVLLLIVLWFVVAVYNR